MLWPLCLAASGLLGMLSFGLWRRGMPLSQPSTRPAIGWRGLLAIAMPRHGAATVGVVMSVSHVLIMGSVMSTTEVGMFTAAACFAVPGTMRGVALCFSLIPLWGVAQAAAVNAIASAACNRLRTDSSELRLGMLRLPIPGRFRAPRSWWRSQLCFQVHHFESSFLQRRAQLRGP